MLTKLQNDRLTLVENDAPMGRLLRENYWLPFCRPQALNIGDAPTRVRLVGTDYVAFRAENGEIGFFDEGCPHRGVSLALARVEGCALRCIFHGWKIDVTGRVLEIPCEGEDSEVVAARIKVKRYPIVENGGLVWVFLGHGTAPAFPHLPFCNLPAENLWLTRTVVPTNWLQGLEAALDSSHVGFLHQSWLPPQNGAIAVSPKYQVENTPYGMQAAAIRPLGDGTSYLRVSEYFMPLLTLVPGGSPPVGREGGIFIAVPVDDTTHLLFWGIFNTDAPVGDQRAFYAKDLDYDEDNYAIFDGTRANNWGQDRAAMKAGHFSGFTRRLLQEDIVVQVSMGPIANRTREILCKTDLAIARCRALLLSLIERFEAGEAIDGAMPTVKPTTLPVGKIMPSDKDWRTHQAAE